ncbi:CbrC family protein [Roseivirga seohaensis]|uniref:CbrC family protein n=1 Tax=Roseivirga seohaensis TaxID=1914963 RepID=UPI003BABD2F1|tara:strand:+ start:132 stop:716 length:585 start_codon:yes stop_codon:yes gene_type:complete
MDFKYFKGPWDEMSGYLLDKCKCAICQTPDLDCFLLDYSITKEFDEEEIEGKAGCFDCLRKGKFEFWHDTEFGFLDENGLSKVYSHNLANPPLLKDDQLIELRRTPQIVTWQQELWLTHCNDFMVYIGTWEPVDFQNRSNGNGRDLFLEMTDEGKNLWDDCLEEGENYPEYWHATYYVFQCLHCGKHKGNWDCS